MNGPDLRVSPTAEEAAKEAAQFISTLLTGKSRVTFAISGGNTPKPLFADLAKAGLDWANVHIFWVDERCVPPDNEQNNYRLANETLLTPAKIPSSNIHRICGELAPAEAAARYVNDIREFFGLREGELPVFDVVHRGMGSDAHTASLFPGTPLVNDRSGIATNVWVEKVKMDRITLLPGVLMAARHTILQVAGSDKAQPLHDVLTREEDFEKYPCQIASRDSRAVWFLDNAAASQI